MLSLIIITHNRRDELLLTLKSLKKQDMSFELIVVDNASNYSVDSLVKSCWPDAKLIELTSNEGVAGGRNAGINAAMGETLVFLDDDASFRDDNVLSLILKKFKDDSDLGILATNSYLVATGEPD